MKNVFRKVGFLLLMLCATSWVMGQTMLTENLLMELQALQKQLVPDARVAILHIEVQVTLNPVLRGETDLPQAKAAIIEWFKNKGVAFVDSIMVLPDAILGDKTWALATLSVSNLRAQPGDASELVSQAVMGTPMKVLDVQGNWYRVQTPDFYIGWMDAGGLVLMTPAELDNWKRDNRFVFNDITGAIVDAPRKKAKWYRMWCWATCWSLPANRENTLKWPCPMEGVATCLKNNVFRSTIGTT
jgi:gamma-D-glutamyl-L-lysine dipeptidyl-peptidase